MAEGGEKAGDAGRTGTNPPSASQSPSPSQPPSPQSQTRLLSSPSTPPTDQPDTHPPCPPFPTPNGHPYELLIVTAPPHPSLRPTLTAAGCVCDEATDGQTAVDRVLHRIALINAGKGRMYDGILMDLWLPLMDGDMAAKEIRELGFDGAIVGMMGGKEGGMSSERSSEDKEQDLVRFLAAGGNRVLSRPVDVVVLRGILLSFDPESQFMSLPMPAPWSGSGSGLGMYAYGR